MKYIYQQKTWPNFIWDESTLLPVLTKVRYLQGRLFGKMDQLGFGLQTEATLQTLTLDIVKSSEIEGEILNPDEVRSSIARRLGIDIAGLIPADRNVEGVVEMMLDATQNYTFQLSEERLFGWYAALFPTGRSGMYKIVVGNWRQNAKDDPMQVISGAMGKEKIHYQAPDANLVADEMNAFIKWANKQSSTAAIIQAAIAHLWFVTIHPFEDGNGRIARAITDMMLARADGTKQRFYSMSAQIRKERNAYYDALEQAQQGSLDITPWLHWFFACLERSIIATDETLALVLRKAEFWKKNADEKFNDRQKLMINKLLDGFTGKLNTSKWAKITKTSSDTALRDINDLVKKGILQKENEGGRSTNYNIILL